MDFLVLVSDFQGARCLGCFEVAHSLELSDSSYRLDTRPPRAQFKTKTKTKKQTTNSSTEQHEHVEVHCMQYFRDYMKLHGLPRCLAETIHGVATVKACAAIIYVSGTFHHSTFTLI